MDTLTTIVKRGKTHYLRIPPELKKFPSKRLKIYRSGDGLNIVDPVESRELSKALRATREK
ncbi:MAG: hypothetical protein LBK99_00340 [Opitutaceae bacterium]|jgi:virulence-associated protein VagC|nr:hypothetical protein [Opitutaceae bacterium]